MSENEESATRDVYIRPLRCAFGLHRWSRWWDRPVQNLYLTRMVWGQERRCSECSMLTIRETGVGI